MTDVVCGTCGARSDYCKGLEVFRDGEKLIVSFTCPNCSSQETLLSDYDD